MSDTFQPKTILYEKLEENAVTLGDRKTQLQLKSTYIKYYFAPHIIPRNEETNMTYRHGLRAPTITGGEMDPF